MENFTNQNRKIKLLALAGWSLFILCLVADSCEKSELKHVEIKVKEVVKTLPKDTIVLTKIIPKIDRTNEKKLSKDIAEMYEVIKNYQEQAEELQMEFEFADSIHKDILFKELSELKEFESNFEDNNLKLKLNGFISGGEIKEITPKYMIKEQTIKVPKIENKQQLMYGVGVNSTLQLEKISVSGYLGLKTKKDAVIFAGYNTDKQVQIGILKKLF